MPSCPIAMPSSTAMVLNSLATPPAASISRATSWPRSFRWTWPGTNWVKELATAIIGLPKSPSFMPVARQRPRAPAMFRPCVVVRERYGGIGGLLSGNGSALSAEQPTFWHFPPGASKGREAADSSGPVCGSGRCIDSYIPRCCRVYLPAVKWVERSGRSRDALFGRGGREEWASAGAIAPARGIHAG